MTTDELLFFNDWPGLLPIYASLLERLRAAHPDLRVKVCRTQISLYNRHLFAALSLPVRRGKGWPKAFLLVSFGLAAPLEDPRIAAKAEAYPGRWTHHVCVEDPDGIDETLLGWLEESWVFAASKR